MKTFKSVYFKGDSILKSIPDDGIIYSELESIGYNQYIPKIFLTDLLLISKYKLLHIVPKELSNNYIKSLYDILNTVNIKSWLKDTLRLLKVISSKYDIRILENYAVNKKSFSLNDITFSFNYEFDLKSLDLNIIKFLKISDKQLSELEKLPEDIIKILTLASGSGNFIKTSIIYTSGSKRMTKYGDIVKLKKSKFADPLFEYKIAIKNYDINKEITSTIKSDKIVVGFFLTSFSKELQPLLLFKLLGVILLSIIKDKDNINVIVYSFFGKAFDKFYLTSIQDIIDLFSKEYQLKIFPVDNDKALETMMSENPNSDIVYIPNINKTCSLKLRTLGCKVNLISTKKSKFNTSYSNVCKKTRGSFLII